MFLGKTIFFYARASISAYQGRRALLNAAFFYSYLKANSAGMSHAGQKGA